MYQRLSYALVLLVGAASAQMPNSPPRPSADPAAFEELRSMVRANVERVKDSGGKPDRLAWILDIQVPGNGGWEVINLAPDDFEIHLGTTRRARREGSLATVWLRNEKRDGDSDRSGVSLLEFDCERSTFRPLMRIWYSKNNLEGESRNTNDLASKSKPVPIVPGSSGENWLSWACEATAAMSAVPPEK